MDIFIHARRNLFAYTKLILYHGSCNVMLVLTLWISKELTGVCRGMDGVNTRILDARAK